MQNGLYSLSFVIDAQAKLIDDRNGDFLEIVRARCSEQSGTMRASYGPDDGVSTLSAALECCFEVRFLDCNFEEDRGIHPFMFISRAVCR